MSIEHVIGTNAPAATGSRKETSDREFLVVFVEGLYDDLDRASPSTYCPAGYVVERSSLDSTGDGFGKLTLNCVRYDSNAGSSFSAVRTTFRIEMVETQYNLEDHPAFPPSVRQKCVSWLATEEEKRVRFAENGVMTFFARNAEGELEQLADFATGLFCRAYMAGIKTFNRYFPVIEKISIWKNPPGLLQSGRSFTRGSPTFSRGLGKYDSPPLTLNGYPAANWFKSKDSWTNNADTTWTRTEQWTYTPEGRDGDHAWIYADNVNLNQ